MDRSEQLIEICVRYRKELEGEIDEQRYREELKRDYTEMELEREMDWLDDTLGK